MSTMASGAKAQGQEVLDDISAAQQYILDLQVLFYSLKTVSANAQKEAEEAGRKADAIARDRHDDRVAAGAESTNAALQRQVDTLTQQLEAERLQRTRLQEQYDQAVAMLRKSYGQIVDDYLFATEQLHARTKQLEGLMEATTCAGALPTLADPAKPGPARAAAAFPGEGEHGDRCAEEHPPRPLQHEAPSQREELSGAWGSLTPNFSLGRSSFRGDMSASPWEAAATVTATAPGAPPSPLVQATAPDLAGSVTATWPHHRPSSRHLPGAGVGGDGAAAAPAGEQELATGSADGAAGGAAPGAASSRTSSQGSTGAAGAGSGGGGGAVGGAAWVGERQLLAGSGPHLGLTARDQPLLSQRSKQPESGPSGFLESVRQVFAPSAATPAPQARSPRAKASARLRLPGGGGSALLGALDTSPLSSPPGEAPGRQAPWHRELSGPGSTAAGTAAVAQQQQQQDHQQVLTSSSSAPSPVPALWDSRREEPPPAPQPAAAGSVVGARGSAGALPGDVEWEAALASELRRSLAGHIADGLSPTAFLGPGQRRGQAVVSESSAGFAHPYTVAAAGAVAAAAAVRTERLSEAAAAALLGSQLSYKSTGSADAHATASATIAPAGAVTPLHGSGARQPQPTPSAKLPSEVPDLTDQSQLGRGQQRRERSRSRQREREREREWERQLERERPSRARSDAHQGPDVEEEPDAAAAKAAAPLSTSRTAQSAARVAAAELGTAAAAAAASRYGLRSAGAQERRQGRQHPQEVRAAATPPPPDSTAKRSGAAAVQRRSPHSPLTSAVQGRDRAHRHHAAAGASVSAAGGPEDESTSATKRLRRSVSSPAERSSNRRTGAVTDEKGVSPVKATDAAADAASQPGRCRASSRAKSRPVPPAADPAKVASSGAGEPKMAAAGEAAAQPQEPSGDAGGGVPLSRRRSLRHFLSVHGLKPTATTTVAAAPTPEGPPAAQEPAVEAAAAATIAAAEEPLRAARTAPSAVAAGTAVASLDASGGGSARLRDRDPEAAAGSYGRGGAGPASDRTESAAGTTTPAAGGAAPRELDEYLARIRARYSVPYQHPAATDAATAVDAAAGVSYKDPERPYRHEQGGPGDGDDTASRYGIYGAARSSARAASTAPCAAAVSSGGGSGGTRAEPGSFKGRDAATAAAPAPAATPVAAPGREGAAQRRGSSGDCHSSGSSASIEGLASLVRSLRKRLAGMQQEYGITADDDDDDADVDDDVDALTDDAGAVDDVDDGFGDADVDVEADGGRAPRDWLTDDDQGAAAGDDGADDDGGGDLFRELGFDGGDSFGDAAVDDGDDSVLGCQGGEEYDGAEYGVYGTGEDGTAGVEDSDASGIEDADDGGNDVLTDTYNRLFRGMFSASLDDAAAAAAARVRVTAAAAAPTAAAPASVAVAGRPYSGRLDAANEAASLPRQGQARRDGVACSIDEDAGGNLPYFSGAGSGGGGAGSTLAGTPKATHDLNSQTAAGLAAAAGGAPHSRDVDDGVGRGAGGGVGSGGLNWASAGGPAGSKAASPALAHRSTGDARTSLASLLDAVNAGTLGATLGAARTFGGGTAAAAAAAATSGSHSSGTPATHGRALRQDRAGAEAAPWAPAAQPAAACWSGATGPASGPELHPSKPGAGAGVQPDRVPPPDQTSPRKDSSAAAAAAAAAAAFGGVASKWKVLGDRRAAEPSGAGAGSAGQGHGQGAAVDGGSDADSFAAARWRQGGDAGVGAAIKGGAGYTTAGAPEAPGAPPPPPLQNVRGEAMFARIKQQLDELQSSFSAGLSRARGADDAGGGNGGGSGGGRASERRSAAAAPAATAAARSGNTWRDTDRETLGCEASNSTIGGGSGGGSDGGRGGVAWMASGAGGPRGAWSGDDPGSTSCISNNNGNHNGTRGDSFSEGGLQKSSSRPMGATVGGAAQVRTAAWEDALNGVAMTSLSGRGDADGGDHHHGADARSQVEAEGVALRRKSLSASMSAAGVANAGGSGAAVRPHGIVLHGEGDR